MFCKKCGKELEDNVRFCNYCGAEVESKVVDFNEAGGEKKTKKKFFLMRRLAIINQITVMLMQVDRNIIMNTLCHSSRFRQQPDSL